MSDVKYKVVGKEFSGIEIEAFVIENEAGQTKGLTISDTVKLIRGDKISNATCVLDTDEGRYIVSIEDGLQSLKNFPKNSTHLNVLARLFDGDKCVGYKVQDKKGKTYKLSILKIWELASQGCVTGLQAKIVNNNKILLSTDELNLSNLPIIKK